MTDEEVRARNVRIVESFYETERRRNIKAWSALWSPAGRLTFWFSQPTPPVIGKAALVAASEQKWALRSPYGIEVQTVPMADPSQVLARLHLTDIGEPGAILDLWCLFHFDDDGLIIEIEEIFDTANAPKVPE